MTRRLLILANPIAGGGRAKRRAPALAAHLQARGLGAEVYFTSAIGDARERARAVADEGWDGVVAVGGDGTVNEVLNGLVDPELPLAVLPMGTANVLAAELRLPRNPDALAQVIAEQRLLTAAIATAAERRFLLFAGAGVDAAIVERLEQVRTGTLGKLRWTGPILHVARRWPHFQLSATLDDGETLSGLTQVLVTRVRNYGGLFKLTPDVDIEDGVLHVLCFRRRSRLWWAAAGLRGLLGGLRPGPHLAVRTAREVRIEAPEPVPYQIDGDLGGRTPVTVSLTGKQARLFTPIAAPTGCS